MRLDAFALLIIPILVKLQGSTTMLWLIFASLTALFASGKDLASKRGLNNVDGYIVSWALFFFSLPVLIPLIFVI